MDWKDKKFNYSNAVKKLPWNKKIIPKARSSINISDHICPKLRSSYRIFTKFSSSFERLSLEKEVDNEEEEEEDTEEIEEKLVQKKMPPTPRSEDIESCMCEDCLKQESKASGIRTREISTFRLVIQGPEILNYQGTKYSPEDVAPYWKKDSRMWLWKSVRLAQRLKSKSKSQTRLSAISRIFKSQ